MTAPVELLAVLLISASPAPAGEARGPVLTITAHPDDETMFGGTLGYLAERGVEIYGVCITRGEGGHTNLVDGDITKLGHVRPLELQEAAKRYGYREMLQLAEADAAFRDAADLPTRDADMFLKSGSWNLERIRRTVETLAMRIQPEVVITLLPDNGAIHAHHQAAARITLELAKSGRLGKRLVAIYGSAEANWYPAGTFDDKAKAAVRFSMTRRSSLLGMTYGEYQKRGALAHATQDISTAQVFTADELLFPLIERNERTWFRRLAP